MYINSFCSISPAGILDQNTSLQVLQPLQQPRNACLEPEYTDLISPMQLRRMTKPVRTGVAAAKLALRQANISVPDTIHVGTAYGMLQDSEHFLEKMIAQEEQMLTPTSFIQSTHNTVSGQIALSLGCHGHNMTFVHEGHSFESAYLDAELMLAAGDTTNALLGAVEECTDTSYALLRRFGVYTDGICSGEGAAFFCLTNSLQPASLAHIDRMEMYYASDAAEAQNRFLHFMQASDTEPSNRDVFLNGGRDANGLSSITMPQITYEQFCGSFPVAGSFALAMACRLIASDGHSRCWILHRSGNYYSFWCVSAPDIP
jgi:3-oxoacyl-[acyl-carrier-protein] synthase II